MTPPNPPPPGYPGFVPTQPQPGVYGSVPAPPPYPMAPMAGQPLPGYPFPGVYVPLPAPQKDNAGAIVAVVIVIVVLVFVVPVLYVLLAGLGPSQAPTPPTVVLQGGGSWVSNANLTTYTFAVSTVTPTGTNINPTQIQYVVSNSAGTPLYSGAARQNTSTGGFTINVVYQDPLGVGAVSAGDRIQITVTPVASNPLVGGRLQVNSNGNSLGTGRM